MKPLFIPSRDEIIQVENASDYFGNTQPEGQMKKVCAHCPYRKDRPNWLTGWKTWFNVNLIHRKRVQLCHMACADGHKLACYGAKVCLGGGDKQIVSPDELGGRSPVASDKASGEAYYA